MVSLCGLSEFSTGWDHTLRLTFLCGLLQLTEDIGKLEDKVECANNALKADWERWKQNMRNDLKSAFTDTAEENIRYYEQVSCASWLINGMLLTVYLPHWKSHRHNPKPPWWLPTGLSSPLPPPPPTHTIDYSGRVCIPQEGGMFLMVCLVSPFLCLSHKELTKEEKEQTLGEQNQSRLPLKPLFVLSHS